MAGKTINGKTAQRTVIKIRLCPDEGRAGLEAKLSELAKEIASSLSELDSSQSKELLGGFVSELFLSVAEKSRREKRRQKQAEGIAAAKAQGVRFGPPRKPLPDNFDKYHRKWRDGELTMREAAKACGMPKSSFYEAAVRKEQSVGCAV